MPRKPIGDAPMTVTERSRRSRAKVKALIQTSQAASPDLLTGGAEAIATRILERVPVETARDIAMALQQRLLQGGCWPLWRLPML